MDRLLAIVFLLTFAGGYADATGYLLTGSFTGHLTGNTVLLTIHLAQAGWREAANNALAIVAFAAGIVLAECMASGAGKPTHARQLCTPLWVEGALGVAALASRLVGGWVGNELCVGCLCLMMGQQNGALRRYEALNVRSTFITGLGRTLLSALVERASGQGDPEEQSKQQPGRVAVLLIVFTLGAFAGACAGGIWKVWSLAGLFVPLAASLGLALGDRE